MMTLQTTKWDVQDSLNTLEDCALFIQAAIEEAGDDPAFITAVLGDMARSPVLGLSTPIRDEDHYRVLLGFVDDCFERFGGDEHHPLFALVDLVADRIREYEDRAHPWPYTSAPATQIQ